MVMALTSCVNTVITLRRKKGEQAHNIESYQTQCHEPIRVLAAVFLQITNYMDKVYNRKDLVSSQL